MRTAKELNDLILQVKGKLLAEEIDFEDYDKAIECLSKCMCPKVCIEIYENYINY
jgi:hypothetical protein